MSAQNFRICYFTCARSSTVCTLIEGLVISSVDNMKEKSPGKHLVKVQRSERNI